MMDTITKALATVEAADNDTAPHGAFQLVLSTPTADRDGEEVKADEWALPLPEHITFDVDHGMSVASTVGSGTPSINADGQLVVSGTYASTDLGQTTRALVNEGHIRTASVAFLRKTSSEKGHRVTRELLNGAFVAIPANPEAKILMSKSLAAKEGKRNASSDQTMIQSMHDTTSALGATCDGLGDGSKSIGRKDLSDDNPVALAQAVDAALDEATDLFATCDPSTLPPEVAQAIALVTAAEVTIDSLLDALGIYDADDEDTTDEAQLVTSAAGATSTPAPGNEKSFPGAGVAAAPAADTDDLALRVQAMCLSAGVTS